MHASPARPSLACRLPFQYNRCSAAAALAGLCECQAGRNEARSGGAIPLLKNLVLQQEEPDDGAINAGEGVLEEAAGPGFKLAC